MAQLQAIGDLLVGHSHIRGTRVLEPVSCDGPYEVYHLCGRVEIQVENMEKVSKITFPSQLADS